MVKHLIGLISFISVLCSVSAMALTNVSASIDKNPVMAKESFVLEVIADDDVNNSALDTSVLLRDFIVGRTSVSSQTSMINFDTTKTTRFTTVLIARKPGVFVIPAFNIEGKTTAPITVKVLNASEVKQGNYAKQQNLFITTEVSTKQVYVQQQLTLTVKLHFASDLKRGTLSEPTLEGASITQIGKDKEADTILAGKRYRVIERTYAISPQTSGEFILQAPVFSGEVMMPSARRSNFLSFGESKPVSVVGDDINIEVKAIPTDYQGQWLPSELLSLHQEWQPNTGSFKVGEPITRTITLTAAGLSEEQLPKIEMSLPYGLKVYPDQAQLHTGMNNERLVSQKIKNFAIVASKAGTFELPELVIPWWNTVTNKFQQAKIPAQTITVLPSTESQETENGTADTLGQQQTLPNNTITPEPATIIIRESSWLQWLFLALWLLTSAAWLISHLINKSKNAVSKQEKSKVKQIKKQKTKVSYENGKEAYLALLAACKQNNGELVLDLMVTWVNFFPQTNKQLKSIDEVIATLKNDDFAAAIADLQQCYFGKTDTDNNDTWQGNTLLNAIQNIQKTQQANTSRIAFSLNP